MSRLTAEAAVGSTVPIRPGPVGRTGAHGLAILVTVTDPVGTVTTGGLGYGWWGARLVARGEGVACGLTVDLLTASVGRVSYQAAQWRDLCEG